jgi:hypothetical protein
MAIGTLALGFTIDLVFYPSKFIGIDGDHPTDLFAYVVMINVV